MRLGRAVIDLNADLGEGAANDLSLLDLVSSANIACGGHAGDPVLIRRTLEAARDRDVRIGAHPGYIDREHFGRRELNLTVADVASQLHYQVGGFLALARVVGVKVHYLKPHGALYNQAMRDETLARVVAAAAYLNGLELMGLPESQLEAAASFLKIPYIREGFADRRYAIDGSLVPRDQPDAFVHNAAEACIQIERLIRERGIQSICIHGDSPAAIMFAEAIRAKFET